MLATMLATIDMNDTIDLHPQRPAVTVDCVVFGFHPAGPGLQILLIERGITPFLGMQALPGGFVRPGETLEVAARRELQEETGLSETFLEQLYTFGNPNRDPRGWVITVAYYALVFTGYRLVATADARAVAWHQVNDLPQLAFDHAEIVALALERLRGKIRYRPIGFELLPEKFTLPQLQRLYETVLGRELDKRNFRKKVLSYGLLTELEEYEQNVPRRPGQLYRFDLVRYRELEQQGFLFEV
jgi:8-oxo-dGTP diphosphatase